MGGGSKVSVPGPSAEERELQRNQAELLALQREIIEQTRAQQQVLLPFFAEQEGFDVEVDEDGNITSITRTPTELEQKREQLEEEQVDRSLAALRGELPVSPALERELGQQERTLREQLAQQFGPGFETSTPGIQTLGDFFEVAEGLREGARTAQLTLADQLALAREEQRENVEAQTLNFLTGQSQGIPLTLARGFGTTAQGFGVAQQPFIQHRQMQTNAAIANAQQVNPWGQIAGTAIGALFSDARFKQDIEPLGFDLMPGVPAVSFRFKHEVEEDPNAPCRIGVLAQDVQKVAPEAVHEVGGLKFIEPTKLASAARRDAQRVLH